MYKIPVNGSLRVITLSVAFVIVCSMATLSAAESEKDASIRKAIDILAGESVLVSRMQTGFGEGRPYEQAWAFSVIVKKSDDPIANFVLLTKSGSYYGLIGLRKLDIAKYRIEVQSFSGDSEVRLLDADSFIDMSAKNFIQRDLEVYGDVLYEKLIFAELPRWEDTVKVKPSIRDRRDSLLRKSSGNQ